MAIYAHIKGRIYNKSIIGHMPREISRFCKFYIDYGGKLEATVTSVDFRRSQLPQGGLEIPIKFSVVKGDVSDVVFQKMREYITSYYIEPDQISVINEDSDGE